jgi:predicted peroxiredoxin
MNFVATQWHEQTIRLSLFQHFREPLAMSAGIINAGVSFIMSEKIQISRVPPELTCLSESINVLRRHRAPKMSVPPATDALSNEAASCRRAWVRLSVKTPCASGVQPFKISCTEPNDSVVIVDTTTLLLAALSTTAAVRRGHNP